MKNRQKPERVHKLMHDRKMKIKTKDETSNMAGSRKGAHPSVQKWQTEGEEEGM